MKHIWKMGSHKENNFMISYDVSLELHSIFKFLGWKICLKSVQIFLLRIPWRKLSGHFSAQSKTEHWDQIDKKQNIFVFLSFVLFVIAESIANIFWDNRYKSTRYSLSIETVQKSKHQQDIISNERVETFRILRSTANH